MTGEITGARCMRAPGSSSRDSRGAATAEAAAVMPVLIGLVLALVWLVSLAGTQIRVVDAAREAARAAARADAEEDAIAAGRRVAPEGSDISVVERGDDVVASVSARVRGPGGLFAFLPFATAQATATAAREDR